MTRKFYVILFWIENQLFPAALPQGRLPAESRTVPLRRVTTHLIRPSQVLRSRGMILSGLLQLLPWHAMRPLATRRVPG